ncbi:MAG: hypothetical protein LBR82_02545 [Desulfovibrio sp.]|jgi:hypothetical protein|nr:hypothetical protein [Desulfovibrio sp.]
MTIGKKATLLLGCLLVAAAGVAGVQYWLDNIKLPAVSPTQVVEDYFSALKGRDYKKAYGFISLRHYNNSFNQFIDRAAMYAPDMHLEVTGENITKDTAVVATRVVVPLEFGLYSSDSSMDLVRVQREWKIVHP